MESLLTTTAEALSLGAEGCGGLQGSVYLFLCGAYEAGLSPVAVCHLFGLDDDCVLSRAGLSDQEEDLALEAYAAFDGILSEHFASGTLRIAQP